jgi:uncharacterized protein (DUF952 family)
VGAVARRSAVPHLYGALPLAAVRWVKDLPLDEGGHHLFPQIED